ncbi:MAG: 8-amino-7-oxononanoate synthase [Hyphomicrobiaceae bacterium]|nr:8-amino-7-oxononanoate synthase [Hyphomicrobiaceae bacterium]MCC0007816.1 8-amino-7-oxononanoate synthase [Hyphomicrobiaceae bacterium]
MHEAHKRSLQALARRRRLRALAPRAGLDFSSNDYLALANSEALRHAAREALDRGVPPGSGGSRLLRGNDPEHEALEAEAATYFGSETALFFGGGFAANTALFGTLPQRGDLIVHDALIHASVHDGMAISRAEHCAFAHNDANAAEDAITAWRRSGGTGRAWIAVESLYSMDGDTAPLDDLADIAERHDAMLVIDEAHATGVLGPGGRGLGASLEGHDNVVALHTCGKALGVSGALITLPTVLRDYMVNRARPFIYATAPSPLVAAIVRSSLALVNEAPQRRERLAALVSHFGAELHRQCGLASTGTHIVPIIVQRDERALRIANALQNDGFDVRAIRPPTVPEGTARLRISLTLNVTADDVTRLIARLAPLLEETLSGETEP